MTAVVILPCYGRHVQTLEYATRMRRKAGTVAALWVAVGGPDERHTLVELQACGWAHIKLPSHATYWEALAEATEATAPRGVPILCAVANDVWAGDAWLERGLSAYRERFPDGEGLMGFSGDGHAVAHSCHFLIGRRLLEHLGGWPVHYKHNFGDTELCLRAQALGRYGKATRAVLEHKHVWAGKAEDDAVYQTGRAGWADDEALFRARQARGWM